MTTVKLANIKGFYIHVYSNNESNTYHIILPTISHLGANTESMHKLHYHNKLYNQSHDKSWILVHLNAWNDQSYIPCFKVISLMCPITLSYNCVLCTGVADLAPDVEAPPPAATAASVFFLCASLG